MAIDLNAARLIDVAKQLESMGAIYVPRTLSEAMSGEWELVCAETLDALGFVYEQSAIRQDSQRLIPITAVLSVMADLEAKLVEEMVLKPHELIWRKIAAIPHAISFLIEHPEQIIEAIKQLSSADSLVDFLMEYAVTVFVLSNLKRGLAAAVKTAASTEKKMRSRAFPQSTGKRHWRKAVTTL